MTSAALCANPPAPACRNVAPSNIYPTKDGTYMVIAANVDPMFRRLCQAMKQAGAGR